VGCFLGTHALTARLTDFDLQEARIVEPKAFWMTAAQGSQRGEGFCTLPLFVLCISLPVQRSIQPPPLQLDDFIKERLRLIPAVLVYRLFAAFVNLRLFISRAGCRTSCTYAAALAWAGTPTFSLLCERSTQGKPCWTLQSLRERRV